MKNFELDINHFSFNTNEKMITDFQKALSSTISSMFEKEILSGWSIEPLESRFYNKSDAKDENTETGVKKKILINVVEKEDHGDYFIYLDYGENRLFDLLTFDLIDDENVVLWSHSFIVYFNIIFPEFNHGSFLIYLLDANQSSDESISHDEILSLFVISISYYIQDIFNAYKTNFVNYFTRFGKIALKEIESRISKCRILKDQLFFNENMIDLMFFDLITDIIDFLEQFKKGFVECTDEDFLAQFQGFNKNKFKELDENIHLSDILEIEDETKKQKIIKIIFEYFAENHGFIIENEKSCKFRNPTIKGIHLGKLFASFFAILNELKLIKLEVTASQILKVINNTFDYGQKDLTLFSIDKSLTLRNTPGFYEYFHIHKTIKNNIQAEF